MSEVAISGEPKVEKTRRRVFSDVHFRRNWLMHLKYVNPKTNFGNADAKVSSGIFSAE